MATESDNANTGVITTVVLVGAFSMITICAALTALVRSEFGAHAELKGAYANLGEVRALKTDQRKHLEAEPAWSDRAKGLVSIPIDRAEQAVIGEIKRNPNLATPWLPKQQPDAGADAGPDDDEGKQGEETKAEEGKPAAGTQADEGRSGKNAAEDTRPEDVAPAQVPGTEPPLAAERAAELTDHEPPPAVAEKKEE